MPQKKILLVDDSVTTLQLEKMILGEEPYILVTAADGEEAVEKAIREKPDLILLDIVMPKMDGFEVCRKLREAPATRHTPIIMVSTRAEQNNIEWAYQVGCSDYITKPISNLELLTKVRSHLGDRP